MDGFIEIDKYLINKKHIAFTKYLSKPDNEGNCLYFYLTSDIRYSYINISNIDNCNRFKKKYYTTSTCSFIENNKEN